MGLFTNSQPNGSTFSSFADRNYKCTALSAGTLLASNQRARTLQFWDFPVSSYNTYAQVIFSITDRANASRFSVVANQGADVTLSLKDKTQTNSFVVIDNGNNDVQVNLPKPNSFLTIGTNSFYDAGTDEVYNLSVNGNVRAKRVKVYTTWADYVFEEGYKLPTLEEVEKHITEKGHLLDIPSAKEVETNGIDLGEMNKLLLQKIEELTLYMLDQNKENEKQSKLIKKLEEKVNTLSDKK